MHRLFLKQRGIGLIELMVSITIGLLIMAGVTQLYATSRNNSMLNDGQARIQENLRYVVSQLEHDASQIGSLGCFSQAYRKDSNVVGDILSIDNESEDGPLSMRRYDVSKMMNGTNDDGLLSSDTILFRYASARSGIPFKSYSRNSTPYEVTLDLSTDRAKAAYREIERYDVLLAADCSSAIYFMVTNNPTETPGNEEVIQFQAGVTAPSTHTNAGQSNRQLTGFSNAKLVDENDADNLEDDIAIGEWGVGEQSLASTQPHIYSPSSSRAVIYQIEHSESSADIAESCTAGTPEYCALTRDGKELADGVENFQIEYGWHVDGVEDGTLMYGEADDVPADQWNNIDRLRVTLDMNSISKVNFNDGQTLVKRRFVRTIALRNQIGE